MVLLPDMGEIHVAKLILMIECNEQAPIGDGDVTRHVVLPASLQCIDGATSA
jgi:hypothetical protein